MAVSWRGFQDESLRAFDCEAGRLADRLDIGRRQQGIVHRPMLSAANCGFEGAIVVGSLRVEKAGLG